MNCFLFRWRWSWSRSQRILMATVIVQALAKSTADPPENWSNMRSSIGSQISVAFLRYTKRKAASTLWTYLLSYIGKVCKPPTAGCRDFLADGAVKPLGLQFVTTHSEVESTPFETISLIYIISPFGFASHQSYFAFPEIHSPLKWNPRTYMIK